LASRASQSCESGEHGLRLGEAGTDLSAVVRVPADGGAAEPVRLAVEEEEADLERLREPELRDRRRGERDRRVPRVERFAEGAARRAQ
jgi:hypothetical protein